ncbi:MAG TPA: serine/threonine-protein kinase [Gemmatimonadales bacterium]
MTALSDSAVNRLRRAIGRPAPPERYQLGEIIGQGGMGEVWQARDVVLDRDVAIKVTAPHLAADEFSARLKREARILARLEHPGIVPVHDVGVLDDGRAWYVMRLVAGTRLDVAARSVAGRGELLRIMERLCDTVAYAHAHHVVHRDLKPGNVMLGPFGEVLVLDWGVARDGAGPDRAAAPSDPDPGSADTVVTHSGTVIGTPGYMSPEQAAGGPADERSDVYGLGAILRDLCAVHDDPMPRALASILRRATAGRPSDRYDSPVALRDDLRRLLDGARVHAHRESIFEATLRIASAYRTPILLILAYLAMRLAILWWRGV